MVGSLASQSHLLAQLCPVGLKFRKQFAHWVLWLFNYKEHVSTSQKHCPMTLILYLWIYLVEKPEPVVGRRFSGFDLRTRRVWSQFQNSVFHFHVPFLVFLALGFESPGLEQKTEL